MSTTLNTFVHKKTAMGRWVYKRGCTGTIGQVVAVDRHKVSVRWVYGTATVICEELVTSLNDFQSLLNFHQEKLDIHMDLLKNSLKTMLLVPRG